MTESEFGETEIRKLESMINISRIGENIFFDTCCIRGFEKFNFKANSYKKFKARELEELFNKLSLFFNFVRGKRVYSIREIVDEVMGLKDKLNCCRERLVKRGATRKRRSSRLPSEKILKRKEQFYEILEKVGGIYLETTRSLYSPQNRQTYLHIKRLVEEAARYMAPPLEGKGEKGLIATAIYRALSDNESTSIITQDSATFNLFVLTYEKFQYDQGLLDSLRQNKIKLYSPDPNRGWEFGLQVDNSQVRFAKHDFKFKKRFFTLVQRINESLVSVA